jgi:hypothetical protein
MPTAASDLVIFKGGFSAAWPVVERVLDLETRGARFSRHEDGSYRVVPASVLTADDRLFIRVHRDELRAVLAYIDVMLAEAPL